MMKKFLALMLALVMALSLVACGQKNQDSNGTYDTDKDTDVTDVAYKVAMITDYGDITDQSFNQTTYEACKAFCTENNIEFTYYKPAGDSTPDRIAMVEKAVDEGYNVIVMPGYAFGAAIAETAPKFSDVKFIALDVSAGDLGEGFEVPANLYCAVYQEELCGYMAGYAAVKLGYKNLGFLGGMAVPAVVRYGYGFVQGVDAAAADMGLTDVKVNYIYGGQFFGDADITAADDNYVLAELCGAFKYIPCMNDGNTGVSGDRGDRCLGAACKNNAVVVLACCDYILCRRFLVEDDLNAELAAGALEPLSEVADIVAARRSCCIQRQADGTVALFPNSDLMAAQSCYTGKLHAGGTCTDNEDLFGMLALLLESVCHGKKF